MAVAPQNIMAQLRGMPDAQLAQYAAMHKNDPFIFPLAFQESQTRKQLRSAKEAQLAGVPQPKVVDQDLQQMMPQPAPVQQTAQLPENIGIGQLPAQNLTKMAGGGIVAFEEGGEVPRYNGSTTYGSSVRDIYNMTPEEAKRAAAERLARLNASAPAAAEVAAAESPGFLQTAKNALGNLRAGPALAAWNFGTYAGDLNSNEDAELKKRWDTANKKSGDFEIPESTLKGTGDTSAIDQMAVDMAKSQKNKSNPAASNANAGKVKTPLGTTPPSATPNTEEAKPNGLSGLAAYLKEGADYTGASPIQGQQERLDKQEAAAATDKKDAFNMALMKAGLGMMAGTSRYAFENIGKGAMGGLEDYSAAMKDLKKAGLERDKMRNELENAAYAYKRDDVKGYQNHMEKAEDRAAKLKETQMHVDATLKAAQTTAGAHLAAAKLPGAQERMFATLGGGDVAKGLEKYQAAQADRTGLGFAKLYVDHVSDSRRAGVDPLSESDFLATMSRLSAQMNPKTTTKPTGTIYDRQ